MTHLFSTPASIARIAADAPINTPIAHRHVALTAITTVPPITDACIATQTTPKPRPDREGGLPARRLEP